MKCKQFWLLIAALACVVSACRAPQTAATTAPETVLPSDDVFRDLKIRFAPDGHLAVYAVGWDSRGDRLVLTGDVSRVEAKIATLEALSKGGKKFEEEIRILPDAALGETNWGITTISVANGREGTAHTAELGTQTLLGDVVSVLKRQGRWLYVQTSDGYLSWMEGGSLKLCSRADADAWEAAPLLIMTELEGLIREAPEPDAAPISDVVIGGRVKRASETGEWYKVELPDGRGGYLPKSQATDFLAWKASRQPTPENIERVGRQFVGRPYLWGANTPRGLDCSGFTKLTFRLNGIDLRRNASQQAHDGVEVPLDAELSKLKKGDLLFFGFEGRGERRSRISHVGIYLGNKLFIQSSQRVRISSLNPESPIADPARIRGLVKVRRVLPEN
jgi:gamma-D-glutamyl-L-lysine dipeptidyl-peptidase